MLQVHLGNRLEVLLDRLADAIAVPLSDPFAPERILVQNEGMARWVAQGLAERTGIAANLEFQLPARFFWGLLGAWVERLPERSEWDRERLKWRVFALLPRLLADPDFAGPARYLAGEPRELKTFQLAARIADLFDQYLVYRPDLILAWESGADPEPSPEARWQAALWRALAGDPDSDSTAGAAPRTPHRAALFHRWGDALADGVAPRSFMPERVLVFGLSALPPMYCRLLARLAARYPVELFVLSPCREYWADLVDEGAKARARTRELDRGQARLRARVPEPEPEFSLDFGPNPDLPSGPLAPAEAPAAALLDLGNPLLASWGRAGMSFQDQWIEMGGEPEEWYLDPEPSALLGMLQSDILDLLDRRSPEPARRTPLDPADDSVQVHACHGPHREVQVLHDRLLKLFEEIPGLRPRDILVMAPDIDAFAPHVEAVFGGALADSGRPLIPWSVADRRLGAEQPLLAAVSALLALPVSRLGVSEVLELLEVPAVARRFGLEGSALARVRTWIAETGVRWGLDGPMRAELALPGEDANTWAFGLRRLFLGYALPPADGLCGDVLPYPDLEGQEAEALGGLQDLIDTLARWRADLSRARPPRDWATAVNRLLADCFDPDEEEDALLQPLREALDAMRHDAELVGLDAPLSLDILRAQVADCLEGEAPAQRFLTGRVTFCNMVPMRSIPARVICLIGLNGNDFPRDRRPPGFDLMAARPRLGDRSRREDDRWLFLESLLAARDRLHLSYVGNDQRDNGVKVPSVLVSELLAYIGAAFRLPDGKDPAERLVVRHPLQPFARRLFDGSDPRIGSYRETWCRAARARLEPGSETFAPQPLEPGSEDDAGRTLDLDELIRFLRCPADWFLTRTLGLRSPEEADTLEESEPFVPNALEAWQLRQRLLTLAERGRGDEARAVLRAEGLLPHGAAGDLKLEEAVRAVDDFRARLAPLLADPVDPLELHLDLGDRHLGGWLRNLSSAGLLLYRLGKVRATDLLDLWVRHLALNLAAPRGVPAQSLLLTEDDCVRLSPVPDAGRHLADLAALFRKGQSEPLPLFAKTSRAFAEKGWAGKTLDLWEGREDSPGEGTRLCYRTAFRGRDPLGADFETLARRVFGPLLAALQEDASP